MSRPKFWLYTAGPYLIGYLAAIKDPLQLLTPSFIVNTLFFLIPANIFLYGINDFFDRDTDALNVKKGSKEFLMKNHDEQWLMAVLFIVLAISALLLFLQQFLLTSALLVAFIFLSYAYSAPPFRFKARPLIDSFSNVLYIIPGIIGYTQVTNTLPDPIFIAAGLFWVTAMHLFSAIPDITPDKNVGLATTAVVYGKKLSLVFTSALWGLCSFLVITSWQLFPVSLFTLIYPVIPLLLLDKTDEEISNVYWFFPYLNAFMGFILWVTIAVVQFL